jgi:sugar/nucleoside kinase (ribokinase family)
MTIDEIVSDSGLERITPGGSAFYASIAASFLGVDVGVISSLGPDYPRATLDWMAKRNIDLSGVQKSNLASARFRLLYNRGSRKVKLLNRGPRISRRAPIGNQDIIHLGPVYHEINLEVVAIARKKCRFLALDVQGLIRRAGSSGRIWLSNRNLDDHLNLCDAVKASREEARVLTSTTDPIRMAVSLLGKGPKFALITLGSKGAVLGFEDGIVKVPAYPETRQSDPTGAGDVMLAGWLVAFWRTMDPAWASAVGSAFASLIVRHSGKAKFRVSRRELFRRAGWIYPRVSIVKGPSR